MGADYIAGDQDHGQVIAAGDLAEQEKSAQQSQAAGARYVQRYACAVARFSALLPVTDQQE